MAISASAPAIRRTGRPCSAAGRQAADFDAGLDLPAFGVQQCGERGREPARAALRKRPAVGVGTGQHHDAGSGAEALCERQDRVRGGAREQSPGTDRPRTAWPRLRRSDRLEAEARHAQAGDGPHGMWNGESMCGSRIVPLAHQRVEQRAIGVRVVAELAAVSSTSAAERSPPARRRAGGRLPPGCRPSASPTCSSPAACAAKNGEVRPKGWIALHTSWTKSGQRQLGGAQTAADGVGHLQEGDRMAGFGERDRRGEAVGTAAHDDGVSRVGHLSRVAGTSSPTADEPTTRRSPVARSDVE